MPLVQDKKDKEISLFGLRALNQLISNESSHDMILEQGVAKEYYRHDEVKKLLKVGNDSEDADKNLKRMNKEIEMKQNPVRLLMRKLLKTDSAEIMIETTKAIRNLAINKKVIDTLQEG
jgi:hypothetical protein